jgi:hypothetical protein
MFDYEPTDTEKREYIEQQVKSMQVTHYRNTLDVAKVKVLREQTDEKWQGTYDQKLNEFRLQNGEIETSIDLMNQELKTLGE